MRTLRPRLLAPLAFVPALAVGPACLPEEPVEEQTVGFAALGNGSHDLADVIIDVVATSADGLNGPRDLDFNPDVPGELWVVNREDDSTTTIFDAGKETQEVLHLVDPFAEHFMEEVSSISFSPGMQFGTCQESRNTYNDQAAGNDFMGPALWSADLDIYAVSNPEAVDENGFDLGSHLDMLHESPLCMGIAWERRNVYWTFDGLDGRISRYDFQEDHGPGFDDHSDGLIQQYIDVSVKRVADVPSHMSYDRDAGLLFVADTGNARVIEVDARTAVPLDTDPHFNFERGVEITEEVGATVRDVVASGEHYLEKPSGLALHDGYIFVTDNETSTIQVFDRQGGEFDYLELERPEGSLMGLRVDENGHIWVVDNLANELLRIRPKGE